MLSSSSASVRTYASKGHGSDYETGCGHKCPKAPLLQLLPMVGDNTERQTDKCEIEERAENPVILVPIPLCVANTWPF